MHLRLLFELVSGANNPQTKPYSGKMIRELTATLGSKIAAIRRGECDKRDLPGICWAAKFEDGKRHAESAEPTGLAYIDIDHVSEWYQPDHTERGEMAGTSQAELLYLSTCYGREEELGIVHAQISPSGDGLHIVFVPENGTSLEDAQRTFAQAAGIERYDEKCHDISRLLFLSELKDTLYDALDTLYDD